MLSTSVSNRTPIDAPFWSLKRSDAILDETFKPGDRLPEEQVGIRYVH
jgi:hypothetical protein